MRTKGNTFAVVALVVVNLGVVLCGVGACRGLDGETARPAARVPMVERPKSPTPLPRTPAENGQVIPGEALVHVGRDVPAGTYVAVTRIDESKPYSGCLWFKSSDPEGLDVIMFDAATAGRPQVMLKYGHWFRSVNCPNWRRK